MYVKVLVSGMGLDQLGQVLLDFGCKSVKIQHCDNYSKQTVTEFRDLCRSVFSKHNMTIDSAIICNFDLWELDTGIEAGHMSPIAAYHEDSDRVLLLDTFIDQSWVKIESLYKAMSTTSNKTGKFRGYIVANGTPVFDQTRTTRNDNNNSEGFDHKYMMNDDNNNSNNNNNQYEDNLNRIRNRRNSKRNINKKSRHSKNMSSVDFDFVFDTKQNYNDNIKQTTHHHQAMHHQAMTHKRGRSSRRLSKKLRLYLEFDSENGQKLWKETQSSQYHQKYIVVEYFQQTKATTYGLVTMAICFNARQIANYYNNDDNKINDGNDSEDDDDLFKLDEDRIIEFYQEYYNDNSNKQLIVPKMSKILSSGITLEEMSNILLLFGCESVKTKYTYEIEIEQFRNLVKDTLKEGSQDNDTILLINYDLYLIGTGIANGHIASVAGYNEKNDMVLLMEVHWLLGKCWIPLSLLYDSMNTIDDSAGKYRGCIVVNGLPLFE